MISVVCKTVDRVKTVACIFFYIKICMVAYFSCFFSASTGKQEQRLSKYDSNFIGLNERWKQPAESIKKQRSIKSMISMQSKTIDLYRISNPAAVF